ncbi:MAG: ATP-binding protein [Bacillaceae bacterium]
MKIKTKIVLLLSSLLIILTVGGSIAIYLQVHRYALHQTMTNAQYGFTDSIKDIPIEDWENGKVSAGRFITEGYMTVMKNGQELYKKEFHGGRPGEEELMNEVINEGKFNLYTGPFVVSMSQGIPNSNELGVNFQYYERELTETLANLRQILYIVAASVVLVGTLCMYLVIHYLFKPVNVIVKTMNDITDNESLKKISLKNKKDEFGQIGNAFNVMIDRIQDMMNRQEAFVANASHELKTPITVIEGYAQLLNRWGLEKREVAQESIEHILTETTRMKEGLIEPMLQLTSLQDKVVVKETISLEELVNPIAAKLQMASGKTISVVGKGTISTSRELLEQILYILIDNGLKYSKDDIHIRITDKSICVIDNGVGIAKEDVPYIFDRFFRGNSEGLNSKGTGLGLAIASEIANLIHVQLQYEPNPKGGSMFWVRF